MRGVSAEQAPGVPSPWLCPPGRGGASVSPPAQGRPGGRQGGGGGAEAPAGNPPLPRVRLLPNVFRFPKGGDSDTSMGRAQSSTWRGDWRVLRHPPPSWRRPGAWPEAAGGAGTPVRGARVLLPSAPLPPRPAAESPADSGFLRPRAAGLREAEGGLGAPGTEAGPGRAPSACAPQQEDLGVSCSSRAVPRYAGSGGAACGLWGSAVPRPGWADARGLRVCRKSGGQDSCLWWIGVTGSAGRSLLPPTPCRAGRPCPGHRPPGEGAFCFDAQSTAPVLCQRGCPGLGRGRGSAPCSREQGPNGRPAPSSQGGCKSKEPGGRAAAPLCACSLTGQGRGPEGPLVSAKGHAGRLMAPSTSCSRPTSEMGERKPQ